MSAANLNDSSAHDLLGDGWEDIVDCPVCLVLLTKPKFLSCGHCVCVDCEKRLVDENRGGGITCPKCRKRTFVPSAGLAVNYVLQDVIGFCQQQKKKVEDSRKLHLPYVCVPCGRQAAAHEMWLCKDCNSMFVCSTCACKEHRAHQLLHVDEIIDQRKKQVTAWKEEIQGRVEVLLNGRHVANTSARDAEIKLMSLGDYLNGPFNKWLNTKNTSLMADVDAFNTSFTSVEDDLVGGDEQVGVEELQPKLAAKEAALDTLVERQRQLGDTCRSLCTLVNNFKSGVRRMDAPAFTEGHRKRHASHNVRRNVASRVRSPIVVVDEDDSDNSPVRLPVRRRSSNDDMASLDIESSSEEPMEEEEEQARRRRRPITVFSTSDSDSDNSTRATTGSCIRGSMARSSRISAKPVQKVMSKGFSLAAFGRPAAGNQPGCSKKCPDKNLRRIQEEGAGASGASASRRYWSDSDSDIH